MLTPQELNEPVVRAIIISYNNAELRRREDSFSAVLSQFPELKSVFPHTESDPIENIEVADRDLLESRDKLRAESINAIVIDERPDREEIRSMMQGINATYDSLNRFWQIQQGIYLATAKAIKKIASEQGLSPQSIAGSYIYSDQVMRRVFPTREQAEKYLTMLQTAFRQLIDVELGTFALAGRISKDPFWQDRGKNMFPSNAALDALQKADALYWKQQIDRIYGQRA